MNERVTVACVQVEPVLFDRDGTIDKVAAVTGEAAGRGAELVVFPEAFTPVSPSSRWVRFLAGGGDAKRVFARLARESVEVPGPASERLATAAQEHGVWLAVGANELDGGTIY